MREKRLRPERPRREIPDFDYSYSAMSAHISAAEASAERAGINIPKGEALDSSTVYIKTEQGLQVQLSYMVVLLLILQICFSKLNRLQVRRQKNENRKI